MDDDTSGVPTLVPDIALRLEYRELINETQKMGFKDPKVLTRSLDKSDELFDRVNGPTEAMYDAKLMNLNSMIVKQRTDALHTTSFDPEKFGKRLVNHFKKQKFCGANMWREIGKQSKLAIVATSPAFHFMYGSFEPGAVELKRKARKERTKDEQGKLQKPTNIDVASTSKASKDSTTEVEKVFSILNCLWNKQECGISYLEFVVNPHSFAETIENMFHVAVLVREGAARIYLDSEGHPFIDPIPGFQQKSARAHKKSAQAVYSLTPESWQKIVRKYNITKPRIPTRRNVTEK